MNEMSELFRPEAIAERQNRLHGEVVLKQTVTTRVLVLALTSVILIAAVWIAVGQYARTEKARGILVTTEPSAKVLPSRPGVITGLLVKEGQFVEKGEILAVIDVDSRNDVGVAAAQTTLNTIDARLDLARDQIKIARNQATTDRASLQNTIESATRQMADVQNQLRIQRDIVQSNRALFEKVEEVAERGFITQVDYERRRQNMLNSQQVESRLEQQLTSLEAERSRARSDSTQASLNASRQISDLNTSIEALSQSQAQFQGEKAYTITAPITGRVAALESASGRVARPDAVMMQIVPDKSILQAQIYAPTRAIGFVKVGQEVRLLYDAFPYQRFGSYKGTISDISRIAIDPRDTTIPVPTEEPVYRLTVNLEKQTMDGYGETVVLQPGMVLTANLILERQSFLDWILSPIRAVLKRS